MEMTRIVHFSVLVAFYKMDRCRTLYQRISIQCDLNPIYIKFFLNIHVLNEEVSNKIEIVGKVVDATKTNAIKI